MKLWLIVGAIVVIAAVAFFVLNGRRTETPAQVQVPAVPAPPDPRAAQEAYLADNLKQPDWKATDSGLQYRMVKAADPSAPKPAPGSEVTVNYEGKFIDGRVFDSSYQRNEPATFPLSGVIPGWQEGVPMMRVGETWEFVIPAKLGYGDRGGGPIPGGATLLFKIELLAAKTPVR
jgi:FKBP-type peptidyl-prolyl cis-trans isomerase